MNYPLEKYKYYKHGNRMIAVSTYAGKPVRGIAICSEDDEYDVEKGKRLAAARCNAAVAEKRFKRAERKLKEALAWEDAAYSHREDMEHYYNDASWAYADAKNEIESLLKEL